MGNNTSKFSHESCEPHETYDSDSDMSCSKPQSHAGTDEPHSIPLRPVEPPKLVNMDIDIDSVDIPGPKDNFDGELNG